MKGLVDLLAGHGDRLAVATSARQLSYAELADRVAAAAHDLGVTRRLVLIETPNTLATLIHYLGALAGGHVVLPVPAHRDHSALLNTYDPDICIDARGTVHWRHCDTSHSARPEMHPNLALLLSTSGSTGSPKLVRLSHANLAANASAIGDYLDIRHTDRAATTLPMSYCYGLSVIHSHLLAGAGIILTDHSVVDDQFWTLFRAHRGSTFAGVPYTFELLERIGFDAMELPDLRYVTQAGGRLAAERVRRFATLGQRSGWELFVMYGATEATARMAYLPPEFAHSHPMSIGIPIPGGSFTVEPVDECTEPGVGELTYRGPNVMLGYARSRADLALGAGVDAFRTGDIARRGSDGLYEVIGRRNRFVKLYGLRIDLHRLETILAARGVNALCAEEGGEVDAGLVVAAAGPQDDREVRRITADAAGLPAAAIRTVSVAELPRLASGKPDYEAVREAGRPKAAIPAPPVDLRGLFAEVLQLDRSAVTAERSFVELGGNSLSYVTMSARLERVLGTLPANWQLLPVNVFEDLAEQAALSGRPGRSRRLFNATLETSVALRAAAIVLIVGSHASLFEMWGGAHILLGIAGYNFGRFCLTPVARADRARHLRRTIAWIAGPSIVWIAIALVITDDYHLTNVTLLNKIVGPHDSMTAGRLWFIEVLVWILVALAAVCWLPLSDRLERRYPFGFAASFLAAGLALRYDVFGFDLGREAWFSVMAFWFFAAGWTAAKAPTRWQRIVVTIVLMVCLHGYFGNTFREILVLTGLVLLIWLPAIRCPAALTVVAGLIAEASLYIYLTHFQVYALLDSHPLLGVVSSLAVGVLITLLVSTVRSRLRESPAHSGRRKPSNASHHLQRQ